MTIHPKMRLARIIANAQGARRAVEQMFDEVYEKAADLERLGVLGVTDVLDKAIHDLRQELDIIETAAKAERTTLVPAQSSINAASAQ